MASSSLRRALAASSNRTKAAEFIMSYHSAVSLRKFIPRNPFRILRRLPNCSSPILHDSICRLRRGSPSRLPKPPSDSLLHLSCHQFPRRYGTDAGGDSPVDVNKEMDDINLKFVEAREEIEMAMESKETVYFDEEAECARTAVAEVVQMFESLLARLPEGKRATVQRSMGLKIEQLKAELQQLND